MAALCLFVSVSLCHLLWERALETTSRCTIAGASPLARCDPKMFSRPSRENLGLGADTHRGLSAHPSSTTVTVPEALVSSWVAPK